MPPAFRIANGISTICGGVLPGYGKEYIWSYRPSFLSTASNLSCARVRTCFVVQYRVIENVNRFVPTSTRTNPMKCLVFTSACHELMDSLIFSQFRLFMALKLRLPGPVINEKTARGFGQPNATDCVHRGACRLLPAP